MDEENMYYMRLILGDDPCHKVHYLMEYTDPLACLLVIMLKIKLLPQFCARVKISLRS